MGGPARLLATPPLLASEPPQASAGAGSDSNGSTVRPPTRPQQREGHGPQSTQEPTSAMSTGTPGRHRTAVVAPGVQGKGKEPPIAVAETPHQSPPNPPAEDERGVAARVKAELSPRVLVRAGDSAGEERVAAARRLGSERSKRKCRASPSSAQPSPGAGTASGRMSSSRSSSARRAKRARQASDDEVVVLEPGDPLPGASATRKIGQKTQAETGARVTCKPEYCTTSAV